MTVCSAQITLSEKQFKFYGQAVIDKQTLQVDTAVLKQKIKEIKLACDSVDCERVNQINTLDGALNKSNEIQNNYKITALKQQEKNHWIKVWNRVFKNVIVIETAGIIIETVIIYFTIIKK